MTNYAGGYPLARPSGHPTETPSNIYSPVFELGPTPLNMGIWASAFRLDLPPGLPAFATGSVFQMQVGENDTLTVLPGLPYNLERAVKIQSLLCNIAQQAMLTYVQAGALTSISQAGTVNVTVPDPLHVELVTYDPFTSTTQNTAIAARGPLLLTGPQITRPGSAFQAVTAPGPYPVIGLDGTWPAIALEIFAGAGAPLVVQNHDNNLPLVLYPANGGPPVSAIPASTPDGTVYYVNTQFCATGVDLISTLTTWEINAELSGAPLVNARTIFDGQVKQFASAGAAGTLIPGVAGQTIYLTRVMLNAVAGGTGGTGNVNGAISVSQIATAANSQTSVDSGDSNEIIGQSSVGGSITLNVAGGLTAIFACVGYYQF